MDYLKTFSHETLAEMYLDKQQAWFTANVAAQNKIDRLEAYLRMADKKDWSNKMNENLETAIRLVLQLGHTNALMAAPITYERAGNNEAAEEMRGLIDALEFLRMEMSKEVERATVVG